MNIWKATGSMLQPEAIEGDASLLNHQFHFRTEDEAWKALIEDVEAGIALAARGVERAQEQLRKAEKQAADVVIEHRNIKLKYREFLFRQQDEKQKQNGKDRETTPAETTALRASEGGQ